MHSFVLLLSSSQINSSLLVGNKKTRQTLKGNFKKHICEWPNYRKYVQGYTNLAFESCYRFVGEVLVCTFTWYLPHKYGSGRKGDAKNNT